MFSKELKVSLENKSMNDFFAYVSSLSVIEAENLLYGVWNTYCDCKGNDTDMLYDLSNKEELEMWKEICGRREYFDEFRFGQRTEDYMKHSIEIKYLCLEDLIKMTKVVFAEIYQHALVEPYCFNKHLVCSIMHPIIKETGLAEIGVFGEDREIINDELLPNK